MLYSKSEIIRAHLPQKRKPVRYEKEGMGCRLAWEAPPAAAPARAELLGVRAHPPVPGATAPAPGARGATGAVLGGQLGVAGRGELALQILEDVQREAADHGDGRHLPQEGHGGDEGEVCGRNRRV